MSIIIPTVMMGVLGGFLGSLYIFTQLKMAKVRRQILRSITRIEFLNAVKVIEVVLVSVSYSISYSWKNHGMPYSLIVHYYYYSAVHLCDTDDACNV